MDTIADRVAKLIREQFGLEDDEVITAASTLDDDLGGDSLDRVELSMAIEEDFQIAVTADDDEAWRTVGDVVAFIERAVLANQAARA